MFFDDVRAALVALLSQPIAVASMVLLAGMNAAIWQLVFERTGFPPVLAALLLLPPLTLLLPLYVALARWPSERRLRRPYRRLVTRTRPAQRVVQHRPFPPAQFGAFGHHGPLQLAADGLPRYRIPLSPSTADTDSPVLREVGAWYRQR